MASHAQDCIQLLLCCAIGGCVADHCPCATTVCTHCGCRRCVEAKEDGAKKKSKKPKKSGGRW